jgi:hypothetical protein
MRSYAQHGDRLTEPCGVFNGPHITVLSPASNAVYNGPLPIHVYAKSAQGAFRITLEMDGKLIRNFDDRSYPATVSGFIEWQGAKHIPMGRHLLTILAYDKEGNVSERSLIVYHGVGPAGAAHRKSKRKGKRHSHHHAGAAHH